MTNEHKVRITAGYYKGRMLTFTQVSDDRFTVYGLSALPNDGISIERRRHQKRVSMHDSGAVLSLGPDDHWIAYSVKHDGSYYGVLAVGATAQAAFLNTFHRFNSDSRAKLAYALSPLPKSIFLAGPTPRKESVPSWRPGAADYLGFTLGFDGTVLIPEAADGKPHREYDHQLSWEWEALNQATIVVFWVPRALKKMPAFTTNVEFGYLIASGKVLLGAPAKSPKMSYLKALADRHNVPFFHSMEALLREAVARTRQPYGRFTNHS